MFRFNSRRCCSSRVLGAAVLAACCTASLPITAHAQDSGDAAQAPQYRVIEIPSPPGGRPFNNQNGAVADDDAFRNYYLWFLSRFTHPKYQNQLPKLRGDLQREFRAAGRVPRSAAHLQLSRVTVQTCEAMALKEAYHPAVRVNCMLILGSLNAIEPKGPRDASPPLPEALPSLIKAVTVEQPDVTDDAVLAAALVGILRHAKAGIPANDRLLLLRLMRRLAEAKEPQAGRDPEAHVWLRRRAIEVLGALGLPGEGRNRTEVIDLLTATAGDRTASFALRCDAARALGQINLKLAPGADLSASVRALGQLTVDLGRRIATQNAMQHYLARVHAAQHGTDAEATDRGLANTAPPSHKELVDAFDAKLKAMIDDVNQANSGDVREQIGSQVADLDKWLKDSTPQEN